MKTKGILFAMIMAIPALAYSQSYRLKGLGFTAPQVKDAPADVVASPHQGDIVFYDTSGSGSAGSFYGYNGTGWKQIQNNGDSGLYGTAVHAGTSSCYWLYTSSSWGNFSAESNCPTPSVTVNASAPATKIPGISFSSLPAGSYQVIVSGVIATEADTGCVYRISDGTNSTAWAYLPGPSGGGEFYVNNLSGTFTYGSPQTSLTYQVQARRVGGSNNCKIANDNVGNMQLEFSVIRL